MRSSSPSVFVLGGRGSESALVSPSPSVFVSGGRRGRVSFGGGVVAVVCFCFGGRWRFGVGCVRRRRLFLFRGDGGASQLWWWCRRRRLFLFRGTVAIWSWVCSSSPSVFVSGGRGSESALVVVSSPSSSSSSSVFVLGDGGGESALVVVSSPSSVFVLGDGGGESALVVVSSPSSSSSSSVFVLGDGGGESALVVVSSSSSVFVLGGRGSESALVSPSPSSVFVSGDGGDLELGVFVAVVCFCFGRAGERVSFGVAVVLVVLVCFCFGGRRGRVSFGGGVVAVVCFCFGGRWRFGVGCVRRRRLFLFWAGGGASQLWCRRRRRLFLFRGDGGESASGVRSNGLCPQRVLAAGGLVPVGFKHSWLSTSHYLLEKLCDGDSLRARGTRAPARRRERG